MNFINPEIIPGHDNAWFILYHAYSKSKKRDKDFEKTIDEEMEIAQKLNVKHIIIEDNFKDFRIGDYEDVWCEKNYKYLIDSAHKRKMKVYLYFVVGEVATHSKVYKKHKEWAVKGPFGMEYSGCNSILFQGISFSEGEDHRTRVFCMGSGWRNYVKNQILDVIDKFELDGLYIDRSTYRVDCKNKKHGKKGHFNDSMIEFLREMKKEMRERGKKLMIVDATINPSAVHPDTIVKEYVKMADHILLEVMPYENVIDIRGNIQKFYAYFLGRFLWKVRNIIGKPCGRIHKKIYDICSAIKPSRITRLVNKLKKLGAKKVIIFSVGAMDVKNFENMCKAAKKTDSSICLITGKEKMEESLIR